MSYFLLFSAQTSCAVYFFRTIYISHSQLITTYKQLELKNIELTMIKIVINTIFQAIASFFFFAFRSPSNAGKSTCDSGMSEYSTIYGTMTDSDDRDPLLTKFYDSDDDNTSHIAYTIEKINYYEQSRRNDQEFGDLDTNQMTDVRGTVNVTSRGACEV